MALPLLGKGRSELIPLLRKLAVNPQPNPDGPAEIEPRLAQVRKDIARLLGYKVEQLLIKSRPPWQKRSPLFGMESPDEGVESGREKIFPRRPTLLSSFGSQEADPDQSKIEANAENRAGRIRINRNVGKLVRPIQ